MGERGNVHLTASGKERERVRESERSRGRTGTIITSLESLRIDRISLALENKK